jgi:hypothetical protein
MKSTLTVLNLDTAGAPAGPVLEVAESTPVALPQDLYAGTAGVTPEDWAELVELLRSANELACLARAIAA